MPDINSVILNLLDGSSIPGFYKKILRNLLPDMSQIQKEDIYLALKNAHDKRDVLKKKGDDLCRKYEVILDKLETNPEGLVREEEFLIKKDREIKTKKFSGSSLSSIKQKLNLEALKKQVGGEG